MADGQKKKRDIHRNPHSKLTEEEYLKDSESYGGGNAAEQWTMTCAEGIAHELNFRRLRSRASSFSDCARMRPCDGSLGFRWTSVSLGRNRSGALTIAEMAMATV